MNLPKHTSIKLPKMSALLMKLSLSVFRKYPTTNWTEFKSVNRRFGPMSFDKGNIARYKNMFSGVLSEIPLNYYYLLAQRSQMVLCAEKSFPYPVLGMVHCSNNLVQSKEISIDLPLVIDVEIYDVKRDEKNNTRLFFKVVFSQAGQECVICKSQYWVKNPHQIKTKPKSKPTVHESSQYEYQEIDRFQLPTELGRRYAWISGDFNPIHLYAWTARLFGFKRSIIHGMFLSAKAQESIEMTLNKPLKAIHVEFKRPVFLPKELVLKMNQTDQFLKIDSGTKITQSHLQAEYQI